MDVNIHWIKKIYASRHDYEEAPLKLTFECDHSGLPNELAFYFVGNDDLVCALVKAINDTVAAHEAKAVERESEAA